MSYDFIDARMQQKLRDDPVYFAEKMIGIQLHHYQQEVINFNSKCFQSDTDNVDENSLKLSLKGNDAENEKYNQNININLYGFSTEYG